MSYNTSHVARLKDIKNLAETVHSITDDHEARIGMLEELAMALLEMTNAVLKNLMKEE